MARIERGTRRGKAGAAVGSVAAAGGTSDPAAADSAGQSAPVRAMIDAVLPCVDGGRFAVKAIAGEAFEVHAHAFADGHEQIRVVLRWCAERESVWHEVAMQAEGNDVWRAAFVPPVPGRYLYEVCAWVDAFRSWRDGFARRIEPDDLRLALRAGAMLLRAAAARSASASGRDSGGDGRQLRHYAEALEQAAVGEDLLAMQAAGLDQSLAELADAHPDRSHAAHSAPLPLTVDRVRARFSTWYEMFPRSASPVLGRHGTLRDVEARLPYVAAMGFDVLYLPPIHPIGRTYRKGPNNTLQAAPGDVGSPWAIGADEGGHKEILPELGTIEDFRRLVAQAREHGLEIALDMAFQCSPDHPYVTTRPQWFQRRPDGSVQYAENPPKRYQDIYPLNFDSEDWQALWAELKSVFEHWIAEGVMIFRVDNPHTKAFAFWEWVIAEIKHQHPNVLFLSEAFTRPKLMYRLAKLGFSQSYTYFTWRNTRAELTEYFTELGAEPQRLFFRANVWPNTPDILNEHLHGAPRSVFASRLILAATLSASYGIYGPAYELMENAPLKPGSEEYLDSEKYQLRHWPIEQPDSLSGLVAMVNRIRRENPALQTQEGLRFMATDNEQLIAYAKRHPGEDNLILAVVNLDPHHRQSCWLELDLAWMGIDAARPFQVDDLLAQHSYEWHGARNFIILDPDVMPAHIFKVRRHPGTETDPAALR
ncbi:MAG: alpha-1,4-glucan--maltose-1-phosphate maltosyltransferase [Burkholderiales bacterium]|nr:alpha-1,4-glucan--maltose-1-phosphate maltosyltransferase [Burkholderiales bacterium]